MGMLAAFLKGASGEYTKQRDEDRTNEFQEIRDRRLAELQRENIQFQSELTSQENQRQEGVQAAAAQAQRDWDSENYSFGYGENVVRGGEIVNTGGDRPSSSGPKESLFRLRGSGKQIEYDKIVEDYNREYAVQTKDILGQTTAVELKEGAPSFIDYFNSRVVDDDAISQSQLNMMATGDEAYSTQDLIAANAEWEALSEGETPIIGKSSEDIAGMNRDDWVKKRAKEMAAERMQQTPAPTEEPETPAAGDGTGGLLDQAQAAQEEPTQGGTSVAGKPEIGVGEAMMAKLPEGQRVRATTGPYKGAIVMKKGDKVYMITPPPEDG